jgi:hypothetical protein
MTYPYVKYLGPAHPVWVAVTDTKRGEAIPVPVRDRQRALGIVRQRYAYAAPQRVDTRATSRPVDSAIPLAA